MPPPVQKAVRKSRAEEQAAFMRANNIKFKDVVPVQYKAVILSAETAKLLNPALAGKSVEELNAGDEEKLTMYRLCQRPGGATVQSREYSYDMETTTFLGMHGELEAGIPVRGRGCGAQRLPQRWPKYVPAAPIRAVPLKHRAHTSRARVEPAVVQARNACGRQAILLGGCLRRCHLKRRARPFEGPQQLVDGRGRRVATTDALIEHLAPHARGHAQGRLQRRHGRRAWRHVRAREAHDDLVTQHAL